MGIVNNLFGAYYPALRLTLAQARIPESPDRYLSRTLVLALYLAIGISGIVFLFTKSLAALILFPFVYIAACAYFLHYADMRIVHQRKEISREIVFAGRFLIIELESGVPVYRAFQNLARNYEVVGKYFAEVVERVDLGTPMDEALNEAVQLAPSNDIRRLLWQVLNSLKTGSEVAPALNNVFDQIVREQQIEVKEYGRKLNPLAMFYMMIAIIVPSLGTIMIVVLSTFIGIKLNLLFFTILVFLNVIVQLLFLAMIKAQRPPVDI